MPFSFVHASDLQLGAPLFGVADLPDDLRDGMIDARYTAARRVFDLALNEQADAVILAGGVIAACAGPRAMWFFAEECERLAEAGITVHWSETESELQRWLQYVPLPENVFLANPEIGQVYECTRDGRTPAVILTGNALGSPVRADANMLRIGVIPRADAHRLPASPGVDYWALGGRSLPGAVPASRGLAQFSGTTQGECPDEQGPRGCVLVRTDEGRRLTSWFVPSASIEWHDECVTIDENSNWTGICRQLMECANGISRSATADAVVVRWTLRGHGIVWQQSLREDLNAQLLSGLRVKFGSRPQPVWSLFIEPVADETQLALWRDEESDVGDLARAIGDEETLPAVSGNRREMMWSRYGTALDTPHRLGGEPHFQRCRERALHDAAGRRQPASNVPTG
jgi:hypothetical protein